jgi:SNF2 family DNA or RNA helicase
MKMPCDNLVLLSGSISKGKAENLYTIVKMLGGKYTLKQFYDKYIIQREMVIRGQRFPIKIITGYKNQDILKQELRDLGTVFMKTEDCVSLPTQTFIDLGINTSKEYKTFKKDRIVTLECGKELVGDCSLTKLLSERLLCGAYSVDKLNAFKELLESTDRRCIVFYNFWEEYEKLVEIIKKLDRPLSEINGRVRDMDNYEKYDNSVTLINYAAGSSGINAQKANIIIYYTPPLSAEFYTQSIKRIHRIGQESPCTYYRMVCENSREVDIYEDLKKGRDYIVYLYEE